MATPLLIRIEQKRVEREGTTPRPVRIAQPRWLRRLQAKDLTDSVLWNGAWQRPTDRGAA